MADEDDDDLDIEKDLYIDESALDVEWLAQPQLMMRYSRKHARAEKEAARLKLKLKVNGAILDKDIRSNPESFKITKVTEETVKNAILVDDEQQDINGELIEAEYEALMLKGAVEAVRERKDALQDLVKLHGQQYFAGPSVPRDLSYEAKQKFNQQVSNQTIKIKPSRLHEADEVGKVAESNQTIKIRRKK